MLDDVQQLCDVRLHDRGQPEALLVRFIDLFFLRLFPSYFQLPNALYIYIPKSTPNRTRVWTRALCESPANMKTARGCLDRLVHNL